MEMFLYGGFGLVALILTALLPMLYRVVVPTNEVHIVQTGKKTTSYGSKSHGDVDGDGKDDNNGNTYYRWPTWVPHFGVQRTVMPLAVFDLDLKNYEAYDQGRLPFLVDIKAFFRITDSNTAAQRVSTTEELTNQLMAIVQGSVRTILAGADIEQIMAGRGTFGDKFTTEVTEQLKNWGVSTVKNIELMDIRDANGSEVIHNIMAKKKSFIEMESRQEVAKNKKTAEVSELEARREVDLQKQEAQQQVGLRTVESQRKVETAQQEKDQAIKEMQKLTKEKDMAVLSVESTRKAEIAKQVALIEAEQNKQNTILNAEATLESQKREAQGSLELKSKEAEGLKLMGMAKAESEKAMLMAPVDAQLTLAEKIGSNKEYQNYLITVEQIKANMAVGIKQADALMTADVKIIANSGDPVQGMTKVMDLFSSKGGSQIGSMLEGLVNTDAGKKLLETFTGKDEPKVVN